ncbi:MAG: LuxR C-terminal-related transcriptional regulator [Marmoricola sp.]
MSTEAHTLSVSIMDDYELVVRGVAQMLAPFEDRVTVVELAAGCAPSADCDIVLYDTFAAQQGGSFDCEVVLTKCRAERLVIWTWHVDPGLIESSLSAGAAGYLSKQLTAHELVTALEQINEGQVVVSPNVVGRGSAALERGDWPGRREGLSQREAEIVALIAQGLSNQDIADRAFLSINTVKSYIRSSYRKMGVTSRSRAVLWGLEHGFSPDHMTIRWTSDEL